MLTVLKLGKLFLTIIGLIILKALGDCGQNCSICDQSKQICSSCVNGFILDQTSSLCVPLVCNNGQLFDPSTNQCVTICPQQYLNDQNQKVCTKITQCPSKQEFGQEYFDVVQKIVISSMFVVLQGQIQKQSTAPIILLDNQNYNLVGTIDSHKSQIIDMLYLPIQQQQSVGSQNINQIEYLYSYSQNEIAKWNLITTQNIYLLNLPSNIIISNTINFINQNYLVVLKNDNLNQQFGYIDLKELDLKASQQQFAIDYKIFPLVHSQAIQQICIMNNFAYSFASELFIAQWDIQNVKFSSQIFKFQQQISAMYCLEQQNLMAVVIQNSGTLFLCNANNNKCLNTQTTHNFISNVIFTVDPRFKYNIIFTNSNTEMNLLTYDDNSIYFLQSASSDIAYLYENNGLVFVISQSGALSMHGYNLQQTKDSADINMISSQFTKKSLQSSTINAITMNNNNDLLIANSNLNILSISQINVQQYSIQKKETKRKLQQYRRGHSDRVNGILFDNLYNRIITYSNDGSFRIWDQINLQQGEFRLVIYQYHPDCPQFQSSNCNKQLVKMDLLTSTIFITQYNDNQLILWDYQLFSVSIRDRIVSSLGIQIQNYQFFQQQFLIFCNTKMWQVYNVKDKTSITKSNNALYAVLEIIDGITQVIYYDSILSILFVCPHPDCSIVSYSTPISGSVLFIKYFSQYQIMAIGTSNSYLYMLFASSKFKNYPLQVQNPVYISLTPGYYKNIYIFSQNFLLSYYTHNGGTLYSYYSSLGFASVFSQQVASFANPELHFFYQNTINQQIQNQLLGFDTQLKVKLLLTFTEKISTFNVDIINSKIYVGFQDGSIKTGYFQQFLAGLQDPYTYVDMKYSSVNNQIIAFKMGVSLFNTIDWSKTTIPSAHTILPNGGWFDDQTRQLVTYSNDTTINIVKWNLTSLTSYVFKNGHQDSVVMVYVDLKNDRMISFSNDLNFLIWIYSSGIVLKKFDFHYQDNIYFNQQNLDGIFQVIQFAHDINNNRVFSLNTINKFYSFNYLTFEVMLYQNTKDKLINFWIDMNYQNNRYIYLVLQPDSTTSYIRFIDDQKFIDQFNLYQNHAIITEIRFVNSKTYTVDTQLIVVMDRVTLKELTRIICQNPLIMQFIVFEKMDHIYLYSDWTKGVLSYRLSVYRLSTGQKITDIVNAQGIEDGNIAKAYLDEDSYQLIVFKSLRVYTYLIDVRTFRYTQYITVQYSWNPSYVRQGIVLSKNSKFVFLDSANLRVYDIDPSVNQLNNMRDLTEPKIQDQFYNQQTNALYYIDNDSTAWVQNLNSNNGFQEVEEIDNVKNSLVLGQYFYVITNLYIIKYDNNMNKIKQISLSANFYKYTQTHLMVVDYSLNFICLKLDDLSQVGQKYLLTSYPVSIVTQEAFFEIFLVLLNKVIRFSYTNCQLIETVSVQNIQFIRIDPIRKLIYHILNNGNIILYNSYSQGISYATNQQYLFTLSGAQDLVIDQSANRIFVLRLNTSVPIVNVYSFSNTFVFTKLPSLIVPSSVMTTQIQILTCYFGQCLIIQTPYYYGLYQLTSTSVNLVAIFRDNNILTSFIQAYSTGIQNIFIMNSLDSLQIVNANIQSGFQQVLLKLNLLNYRLINQSLTQNGNLLNINLIGISSGISFNYQFVINIQQGQQSSLTQQNCYFNIPQNNYQIQLSNQMTGILQSSQMFNFGIARTLINVDAKNNFYYDQIFQTLSSSVVYLNGGTDKRVLQLTQNFFNQNKIQQLQIQGYDFDLSQMSGQINFSPQTQIIVMKDINFISNIKNCQFQFIQLQSVILENINISGVDIESSQFFYFQNIQQLFIKNINYSNSKISLDSQIFNFNQIFNLFIQGLYISNINKVQQLNNARQLQQSQNTFNSLISINNSQQVKILISQISSVQSQANINYIFKLLGVQNISFDQVYFHDSSQCQFINWQPLYQSGSKSIYIDKSIFSITNSQCSNINSLTQMSLIYLKGYQVIAQNLTINFVSCPTCFGAAVYFDSVQQISILSSNFQNNIAQSGGALAFKNCGISQSSAACVSSNSNLNLCLLLIQQSIFQFNQALESGGSLYILNSNIQMKGCQIQQNKAIIGGGVRYLIIQPIFVYRYFIYLKSKSQQYNDQNVIQFNKAVIHSNNIGSNLKKIAAFDKNKRQIEENLNEIVNSTIHIISQVYINSFVSGGFLEFQFQLLDEENNPLYFDTVLYKSNGYPKSIQSEIISYYIQSQVFSNQIKLFGQQYSDYNFYNSTTKMFSISGLQVIANPKSQNQLYIQSPAIQRPALSSPEYRQIDQGPFYLQLLLKFRDCIPGEVFRKSGSLYYCQVCTEGTYSLIQPTQEQYSTQNCMKCPSQASYCYGRQMTINDGYWKVSNSSSNIIYCTNMPSNCNGNSDKGYCKEGHIGPLCEVCDIKGTIWGEKYATDGSFNCLSCSEVQSAKYIIPSLILIFGMIVYIGFSLKIALDISRLIVLGYYLRMMQICPVSKSSFSDTTNMNIKSLINYIQISQIVNTAKVQLPSFITFLPNFVGSPIQNMMYTLDCWFARSVQGGVPIIFQRTIWSLSIPVIYLTGVYLIYISLVLLKYVKLQTSYLQSGLVFLFLYLQPNMISNLLSVMSCRKIDQKLYIQADVSYECYTGEHIKYIFLICFPGFLLWAFMIPVYILKKMIKYQDQLDHSHVRMRFGFLYQDYKRKHYYWEFVRSYMKVLIVCIYSFYGDPYTNKLIFALIICILYLVLLKKLRPFQMHYFQDLDTASMLTIIVLIIMNIFLYNDPPYVQQVIFYIILLGIHNIYQLYLIKEVIKTKIEISYKSYIEFVKKKLILYFPQLSKYITLNKESSFKKFLHWKMIKFHIVQLKEKKISGQVREQIFGITSSSQQKLSKSNQIQQEKAKLNNLNTSIQQPQNKSISQILLNVPNQISIINQDQAAKSFQNRLQSSQIQFQDQHESFMPHDNSKLIGLNKISVSQLETSKKSLIIVKNLHKVEGVGEIEYNLGVLQCQDSIKEDNNIQEDTPNNNYQYLQINSLKNRQENEKEQTEDIVEINDIQVQIDQQQIFSLENLNQYTKKQSDSTQSSNHQQFNFNSNCQALENGQNVELNENTQPSSGDFQENKKNLDNIQILQNAYYDANQNDKQQELMEISGYDKLGLSPMQFYSNQALIIEQNQILEQSNESFQNQTQQRDKQKSECSIIQEQNLIRNKSISQSKFVKNNNISEKSKGQNILDRGNTLQSNFFSQKLQDVNQATEIQEHKTIGSEFIIQSPINTLKYFDNNISQLDLNSMKNQDQSPNISQKNQLKLIKKDQQQELETVKPIDQIDQKIENNLQESKIVSPINFELKQISQNNQQEFQVITFQQLDEIQTDQNDQDKKSQDEAQYEILSCDVLSNVELQILQPEENNQPKLK
ncbi:WD domain, G-beta repeat protein (macronuclear) [Tetrahymena thermophila SB210]|uniref:WD domain, G-beta repeat protein n=1 Tax=Tetrahymena thermophila (strain SB210) TaxID=312017 RepID=I7MFN4_TETTS|nr:WD domain, G-beta repeat protein [Tetrahymena thermophila SB210]EAR84068.2 WD domain, G-beta repeat protein [Tetrahymena thermophila SB210]|eukprot:XP_001031731.2 WD domain, G-beta repeat protein [Tetrahymena thermophila SB210]